MPRWSPGDLPVLVAAVLPWLAWIPITHARSPLAATPLFLLSVSLVGLLAWVVAKDDPWLGLLAGWLAVTILWRPLIAAFETAELFALGALGVIMVRRLSAHRRRLAVLLLVISGALQAIYAAVLWGGYDPLIGPLLHLPQHLAAIGLLGNSNFLASYLAILIPLAPLWVLPVLVGGLALTHSLLGIGAATIGLMVRYRARPWVVLSAGLATLAAFTVGRTLPFDSLWHRIDVWRLAWEHTTPMALLVGHGAGSWSETVPVMQLVNGVWAHSVFQQAHNELLQLVFEGGLIALVLLGGWLWTHRAIFAGPYGGAVAALGVSCLGFFPFHTPITAVTALVILGVALPPIVEKA